MPGQDVDTFLVHLRSLDGDQLATLLRRRPDAVTLPWPAHIASFAERLRSSESISAAYYRLPRPHVEVLGALTLVALLEQSVTAVNAAAWLDGDFDAVQEVLDDLQEDALVWPTANGELATLHKFPIAGARFGNPVRTLLTQATLATLRAMAAKLWIRDDGSKQAVVDRLFSYFRDAEAVRGLVDTAPKDEREILLECATQNAAVEYYQHYYGSYRPRSAPQVGDWSVARGMLWPEPEGYAAMPLEISLGLRGDGWRLPFHPEPPTVDLHPISTEHVDAEAATHLLRQIELVSALLDSAAAEPIPLVKSGSVGVRTLRAFAKEADADVDQVILAVELAMATEVLTRAALPEQPRGRGRKRQPLPASPGLIPGYAAAAWQAADAEARGTEILKAWWQSETSVLLDPKLAGDLRGSSVHKNVRQNLIGAYAEFPHGRGVSAGADLVPLVRWRVPFVTGDALDPVLTSVEREAELLGVLALGAATSLGRALITGALGTATAALVSGAHASAVIGADLTAVVFGPPSTHLSRFLDSVATRESRGQATMWRFTPDSVRAAFDRGSTSRELIDELTAIAQSGVPQPLEYLINDVARTHGQVGVVELGCAVVADDSTLLVELVGNRKLTKLGLRSLAPTVVASRGDAATTLSALRAAGYAPVPRDTDGAVFISSATTSVVDEPDTGGFDLAAIAVPDADPDRHARHLIATATQPMAKPTRGYDFVIALHERGDQTAIWKLSAGQPAYITHDERTHLVHSAILHGSTLTAWSMATDRYEDFPIARIAVSELP